MTRSPCLVLLLPALFLAPAAAAQLEFTPYIGAFVPAGRVVDDGPWAVDCISSEDCAAFGYVRQNVAPLVGGRLTAWFRSHWALEVGAFYTPSGTSNPTFGDQSAKEYGGSGRLLFRVTPHHTPTSFYALAGPLLVWHAGTTYDSLETIRTAERMSTGSKELGVVLGVGVRGNTATPVGWVIELEDNFYGSSSPLIYGSSRKTHHDFVLSAGLRLGGVHSRTH